MPSEEGRRAAIKAIRKFHGDDVKEILVQAAEDADPQVKSDAIRLMKLRKMPEAAQVMLQKVNHPSELVRQTIYKMTPEFHIETFFQKVGQMPQKMAWSLGKVIRNVDPNTRKQISQEIKSSISHRRKTAMDVIRYTGLEEEYEETLIDIAENDEEAGLRIEACGMLAHIFSVDSYQTLQRAGHDRNPLVQQAAFHAADNWREAVILQHERKL